MQNAPLQIYTATFLHYQQSHLKLRHVLHQRRVCHCEQGWQLSAPSDALAPGQASLHSLHDTNVAVRQQQPASQLVFQQKVWQLGSGWACQPLKPVLTAHLHLKSQT